MEKIEAGDTVRHKLKPTLNGGVAFNVIEISGDKALCNFFDNDIDQTDREDYFEISDLILVNKVKGGFITP